MRQHTGKERGKALRLVERVQARFTEPLIPPFWPPNNIALSCPSKAAGNWEMLSSIGTLRKFELNNRPFRYEPH